MTELTFVLDQPAQIRLAVFDLSGRLIHELATGAFEAGSHSQLWNGRNAAGAILPGGVYFTRLDVNAGSYSRKLVLLK